MSITVNPAYRDEILRANPSRMVVMIYDETLAALNLAIAAIENDDIETRCNAVNSASELVAALYLCLDLDQGGEVAENLSHLYGFILRRLPGVNIHNDPEFAEEAIRLLTPLRDSWFELDSRIMAGETPEDGDKAAVARNAKAVSEVFESRGA